MTEKTLLIASVGGAPEPIAASIKHWRPECLIFIVSADSNPVVDKVLDLLLREHVFVSPGCYEKCDVVNPQELDGCIEKMRELSGEVDEWLKRGQEFRVVVDLTGGTKCMTAALSLQAHR